MEDLGVGQIRPGRTGKKKNLLSVLISKKHKMAFLAQLFSEKSQDIAIALASVLSSWWCKN